MFDLRTLSRWQTQSPPAAWIAFDGRPGNPYAVAHMSSRPRTQEIAARSPLSGRPVWLSSLLALNLLGILLLLAR